MMRFLRHGFNEGFKAGLARFHVDAAKIANFGVGTPATPSPAAMQPQMAPPMPAPPRPAAMPTAPTAAGASRSNILG